jgi:uncharacterized membrane protein (DUF4010 family)
MQDQNDILIRLLASLAIGLLVGIERGWSDREEVDGNRIAGIRTFCLIGLLGGVTALLSHETSHWFLVAGFLAVSALSITAHILDVQEDKDVGTTTAFTMILTFVLAAWAAYGRIIPAMAVTVIVITLLGHKLDLHRMLRKISPRDFFSGAKLLIISLVILPLLPDQGYGPWKALNPYWIWLMVVVISAISFLGYIVIQAVGEKKGTVVTAIAGALVSSTAVTINLAQFAKNQKASRLFSGGVLLASSIMFPRVLIEVFVVYPGLMHPLWIPLATMAAGLLCGLAWLWLRHDKGEHGDLRHFTVENPLQLDVAIKFGLFLAAVLVLSEAMKEWLGHYGVYALSIASGLMDVDAISLSLARSARNELAAEVATLGIVLACATNTLVKGVLFAAIAGYRENLRVPLLMTAAMLPGLLIAILLL